ncbi:hypothetical protein DSO57_1004134 [Entomophthora muscae]|uniref:Uncharacterized protein n=1 Tax=Entomophthora muscae TaxID=34485 RepID=A0ACC2TJB0_9FUNG|nr:hypothetical protein DSO57_1004134 [Entomophthora muscae]
MFCHSLDPALVEKGVWEPAPPSLKKAFALARKLCDKPAYLPKQGVLATLPVAKSAPPAKLAKPPKAASINVMCCPAQAPNWLTNSGSLPKFAASAAIPDVTSANPSSTILALQNKEDLSYFLFNATFYTKSQKAKATFLVDTGAGRNCQGSNLRGVPEDLRADSPQALQGEPTAGLGLTLQYKITIFQVMPKVCL